MEILVEDYFLCTEYMQGNVNVPGLVFDDLINEEVVFGEECFFVFFDVVEDAFEIACDYFSFHLVDVDDNFHLATNMGNIPVEVYKNVLQVAYARAAAPVRVWWFGVNVVHGPDTFFEEVYSNVHCRVPFTLAVPYYWETVHESFDVEFHNIQPHPGVHKALKLQSNDFFNMRHNVWQEYYFNCRSDERLFAYDTLKWGWGHGVAEPFAIDAHAHSALGRLIDEHIRFHGGLKEAWKGEEDIKEILFAWDAAMEARGWTHLIEESTGIEDLAAVYLDLVVQDVLMAQEMLRGPMGIPCLVPEQLRLAQRIVNTFDVQIQDSFGAADEMLHRWLASVLLDEQTNITVEGSLNQNHEVEISSSLSWEDA